MKSMIESSIKFTEMKILMMLKFASTLSVEKSFFKIQKIKDFQPHNYIEELYHFHSLTLSKPINVERNLRK